MDTKKQIADLRAYAKGRKGELAEIITAAADTIERLERSSGKWVRIGSAVESRPYACSICNYAFNVETVMMKPAWNYCPNCGAKMEDDLRGEI